MSLIINISMNTSEEMNRSESSDTIHEIKRSHVDDCGSMRGISLTLSSHSGCEWICLSWGVDGSRFCSLIAQKKLAVPTWGSAAERQRASLHRRIQKLRNKQLKVRHPEGHEYVG